MIGDRLTYQAHNARDLAGKHLGPDFDGCNFNPEMVGDSLCEMTLIERFLTETNRECFQTVFGPHTACNGRHERRIHPPAQEDAEIYVHIALTTDRFAEDLVERLQ